MEIMTDRQTDQPTNNPTNQPTERRTWGLIGKFNIQVNEILVLANLDIWLKVESSLK